MAFAVRRLRSCRPWKALQRRRFSISEVYEPPLDISIPERPCTLILVEDTNLYDSSWRQTFQDVVPTEHATSFRYMTVSDERESTQEILDDWKSKDLFNINDALLVTRGPLVSWAAQLYLESFSLQGLVMVDPMLMDQVQIGDNFNRLLALRLTDRLESRDLRSGREYKQLRALVEGDETRPLLLEPDAVPMMIFKNPKEETIQKAALEVAHRHSDAGGIYGDVHVEDSSNGPNSPHDEIASIMAWIDDKVL